MSADLKQRWVEALRSGEYPQGKYELCREDPHGIKRYCCLGVLANIDRSLETDDDRQMIHQESWPFAEEVEDIIFFPKDVNRVLVVRDAQDVLLNMNDAGAPFSDIADWIEANL